MATFAGKSVVRTLLLAVLVVVVAAQPAAAAFSVSFSFFHDTLSPHGRWVGSASYGQVWVPRVAAGWAPYVHGEWVYTSYGWTWLAADPWGDVPYRYGTWVWTSSWGWVWVPGYVWAPAWVTWAYTDDYVGWAPVPPSFAVTARGYFGGPIVVSPTRYVFVPANRFVGTPVSSFRVVASRNGAILSHARRVTAFDVSGGIVHNVGPAPGRIERVSGQRIERQTFRAGTAAPARIERTGFARWSSRVRVASPQWSRSAGKDAAIEAPAARPAVSRPSKQKDRAVVSSGPSAKKERAMAATRERARPQAKPAAVRSEKQSPAVRSKAEKPTRRAVARPEHSSKVRVEKASKPNRERPAAVRAPQASKAKSPKVTKPERKAPARRPDRDKPQRGGIE